MRRKIADTGFGGQDYGEHESQPGADENLSEGVSALAGVVSGFEIQF
jgi:hypothetical protein